MPLAATFAEAGCRVLLVDVRRRRRRRPEPRRVAHRRRPQRPARAARRERARPRDHELRRSSREADAILIALPTPLSRQREPDLSIVEGAARRHRGGAARGPARRARVDDAGRARRARCCSRSSRRAAACARARASSSRCRRSASTRAARTGRRRRHRRCSAGSRRSARRRAAELYRRRDRHRARAHEPRGGRAHEAAREHLPLGQHRARQRARDPLRPDGNRHLGGRRRRRDEAVRLHALQPRAGPRRPLHPDRSLLPQLEGARVRLLHGVHRARRQGQRGDAVLLPLARLAGAQPPRAARDEGLADPRARRRVQAGHRRPARVAGAEAHLAAAERGRRRLVPRPARRADPRGRSRAVRRPPTSRATTTASSSSPTIPRSTTRRSWTRRALVVDLRNATGAKGSAAEHVFKL